MPLLQASLRRLAPGKAARSQPPPTRYAHAAPLPRATTHNVRLQDSETVDRVVGRDRLLLVIEILDAMADFAAAPVRELAQAP